MVLIDGAGFLFALLPVLWTASAVCGAGFLFFAGAEERLEVP
jgi:hypothetical protein